MSIEDETGISNVVVMPDFFDEQRLKIVGHPWVIVEGPIQNVDNVIHVMARQISELACPTEISTMSHDFH
jgi:error-prone DNA polymerase